MPWNAAPAAPLETAVICVEGAQSAPLLCPSQQELMPWRCARRWACDGGEKDTGLPLKMMIGGDG